MKITVFSFESTSKSIPFNGLVPFAAILNYGRQQLKHLIVNPVLFMSLISVILFSYSVTLLTAFEVPHTQHEFSQSQAAAAEQFRASPPVLTTEQIKAILAAEPNAKATSEVDIILQAKREAQQILSKSTTTAAERKRAQEIVAFDMHEKAYELQEKSETELKNLGFDDERIQSIKGFGGSTVELRGIFATRIVGAIPTYTQNSSGNWARLDVFFAWDGVPFWNYTDALLAGASGAFLVQRVPATTASINYSAFGATGSTDYVKNYSCESMVINPYSQHLIQGFPFPMAETEILPDGTGISYYAHSGRATFGFRSMDDCTVQLYYGHAHAIRPIRTPSGIDFWGGGLSDGIGFGLSDRYDKIAAGAYDLYSFPALQ